MLTVRLVLAMQNAACPQRVGRLFRLHAFAGKAYHNLPAMWFTGGEPRFALRPLPEKSPPWSALVTVDDYVPPLSGLIHALKFSGQSSLAQPLARLLLLAVLQARRTRALPKIDMVVNVPYTDADTGGAAIIKATCSAARSPGGWVVATMPARLPAFMPPPSSISSTPGFAKGT